MKIRKFKVVLSIIFIIISFKFHAQEKSKDLTVNEKKYILKFIHPLQSYNPNFENNNDLKVLNQLIGASKVVALGEVTHGSSEIFQMKDRIIRYLVQNNNFNIFSIEAAMPESYQMNEFVLNGKNNPKMYLSKMYFWTWRTQEVSNLATWMKNYNETHSNKIQFTGFDMQYFFGALKNLKDLNQKYSIDIAELENLQTILLEIDRETKSQESKIKIVSKEQKTLIDSVLLNEKTYCQKFNSEDKKWGLQYLRIIEQYLEKTTVKRDEFMAENILWIKNNNPNSKLMLWAHNGHIKETGTSMGKFLNEAFNDDYKTIGFTFYKGTYTAIGRETKKLGTFTSEEAYPGTLEYYLNSFDIPIFLLDLKSIRKENNELGKWIMDEILYRRVGSISMEKDFRKAKIADDFDYLIFIKESSNSKILK